MVRDLNAGQRIALYVATAALMVAAYAIARSGWVEVVTGAILLLGLGPWLRLRHTVRANPGEPVDAPRSGRYLVARIIGIAVLIVLTRDIPAIGGYGGSRPLYGLVGIAIAIELDFLARRESGRATVRK
jgi:hypothetical protein